MDARNWIDLIFGIYNTIVIHVLKENIAWSKHSILIIV